MTDKFLPYGTQTIGEDDIEAIVAALKSDFLTQGPAVDRFEYLVAEKVDADHAVAFNSATSALHAACVALGVGPGDTVWTTPNTFVASANCALYCGADVDFVDIDPATFNMSPESLSEKLRSAELSGSLPKVLIVVHFAGEPCDMRAIQALCKRHDIKIIEDASHAIGARFESRPVGCGHYSDITCFSFHPVKIITTAEGGMACTNDEELNAKLRRFRSHGIVRDKGDLIDRTNGDWYYEQHTLGFNYRLTDLQASLGMTQLGKMQDFLKIRHDLSRRYRTLLGSFPVATQQMNEHSFSSLHLFVVVLSGERAAVRRRQVFDAMRHASIGVNVHYIPVHLQPFFRGRGFSPGDFPNAERYYERALSIPLHPKLTYEDQDRVLSVLEGAL